MATSKNGRMFYESGQNFFDFVAMEDGGDNKVFKVTGALVLSRRSGYTPEVRPNGVVTGANLLSPSATNNTLMNALFTAYSKGAEHEIAAGTIAVTRPATNVAKVCSITMTDAGVLAEVEGAEATDTNFSETRGAAGGPPYIPADSVEIGQVRLTSSAAAPILASEIKQVPGTHMERYNLPSFTLNTIGMGLAADVPAKKNAYVEFADAIPAIHTGDALKKVYLSYYAPIFAQIPRAVNFVPAEESHTLSSQQFYDGAVGSVSSALGQASFTGYMDDGITDELIQLKNENLAFKFFPDKNKLAHNITQGIMGMGRTYPVNGQNQADFTISPEDATADFAA